MDILTFLTSLPPDLTKLAAFIGSATFASFIASEVLEYIPQFKALTSGKKSGIVLFVYVLLSLASYAMVRWVPATAVQDLQPVYSIVIGAVAAFLGGQWWHNNHKDAPAAPAVPFVPPITGPAG